MRNLLVFFIAVIFLIILGYTCSQPIDININNIQKVNSNGGEVVKQGKGKGKSAQKNKTSAIPSKMEGEDFLNPAPAPKKEKKLVKPKEPEIDKEMAEIVIP
jgi:hypothetical protein